jgi:hypothetical protein
LGTPTASPGASRLAVDDGGAAHILQLFYMCNSYLVHKYGSRECADAQGPFCRCPCRHFGKATGAVLAECARDEKWYNLLVDVIPEALNDLIQKHSSAFNSAAALLTAGEVMAAIPVFMPKCSVFPECDFPGLGKLPLEELKGKQMPMMTAKNWWTIAQVVAVKDMAGLQEIFDLAEQELAFLTTKKRVRGELVMLPVL